MNASVAQFTPRTQYVEGPFLDLISKIQSLTNQKLQRETAPERQNPFNGMLTYRVGGRFDADFKQLLGKLHN